MVYLSSQWTCSYSILSADIPIEYQFWNSSKLETKTSWFVSPRNVRSLFYLLHPIISLESSIITWQKQLFCFNDVPYAGFVQSLVVHGLTFCYMQLNFLTCVICTVSKSYQPLLTTSSRFDFCNTRYLTFRFVSLRKSDGSAVRTGARWRMRASLQYFGFMVGFTSSARSIASMHCNISIIYQCKFPITH